MRFTQQFKFGKILALAAFPTFTIPAILAIFFILAGLCVQSAHAMDKHEEKFPSGETRLI